MNNTNEATALSPDEILINWQKAKDKLKQAMHDEMHYRLLAIKTFFPNTTRDTEGTENYDLGNNYKLKATFKLNYNLGKRENVDQMLDEIEKAGPEGKFLAERVVNWSPNLSLTEYRNLPHNYKQIVDKQLTIKPGLPSLEIVEPK